MGGSRTALPPGKGGIHMKRICCPFITLLMALSLLSACQPTPEVEPVAQKDSDALIERVEVAEEGVADMAEAPESRHITRELTEVSQKTGIDITIDADVVLPETDAIPVAHVQSGELDMQVMENIWEIVANGSGMLEDFPRSYYEGQASMWMEYREAGNLDKYSSFEEMDAAISELLAEAATKPAEPVFFPESPMDVMQTGEKLHDTNMYLCSIGSVTFFGWSDQGTVSDIQLGTDGLIFYLRDIDMSTRKFKVFDVNPLNYYLPAIERGELKIQLPERSIEDAQAYAEQLLADIGITDFACVVARIAPLLPRVVDWNAGPYPCAYELVFTRQVAGVNVTYNDVRASGGSVYRDTPDYTPIWDYEYIQLLVDDAGVFALEFRQPYEVTEIVTESAEILPLEEAVASFERMIGYQYAAYETGEEEPCDDAYLCIDEIRLGLTRIAEKNAQQQGYLVPSWTFFGHYKLSDFRPDGYGHHGTEAILIVNALDGSIIDPARGF